MKRLRELGCFFAVLGFLLAGCATLMGGRENVSFVTAEQLNQMLGSPDLVVVDVRDPVSWSNARSKIAGAIRVDPAQVDISTATYPKDKKYVFYCA